MWLTACRAPFWRRRAQVIWTGAIPARTPTAAIGAMAFDYPQTLVVYGTSSQEKAAVELAEALGFGADAIFKNDGTYGFTSDFLVVLGADWE